MPAFPLFLPHAMRRRPEPFRPAFRRVVSVWRWRVSASRPVHAALLVSALVALSGCGSDDAAEGPPPTAVTLSVEASPFLNPDRNNRPSPVVVVIYGLTDDAAFNNAGYFELFEQDQQTLGDSIKTKKEFIIAPGDINDLALEIDPSATFLAVLAAFRDIDNAQFSATVALVPSEPVTVQIKLQSNEVVLIAPEPPIVVDDEEQSDDSG